MQARSASRIVLVVMVPTPRLRPPRSGEPGFTFVYVNQDGSARELSPSERAYLSQAVSGGDSDRPYIKTSYSSRDGWGSLSGFIERRKVPAGIEISPVHPDFDARANELGFDTLAAHRAAGDIIETRADGSVACTPNPKIAATERFAMMRRWHLAHQRAREQLARVDRPKGQTNT